MIEVRALPDFSSMILTWIALIILFLILRHFLYKPVSEFLNNRKEKIRSDIEGARALKEEASSLREDYETRISLAKKESQEIIETARKRGEELKENILDEARKEAEGIKNRAIEEIHKERELAFQEIKLRAGEIGLLIASKIMKEEINLNVQGKLIDKFIDEVGNVNWQS